MKTIKIYIDRANHNIHFCAKYNNEDINEELQISNAGVYGSIAEMLDMFDRDYGMRFDHIEIQEKC